MSAFTRSVADALARRVSVEELNLSSGAKAVSYWFRWAKFFKGLGAATRLLTLERRERQYLWMPLNLGPAMVLNFAAALTARIKGMRVVCHHHVYDYLLRRDWRVGLLDRLMGSRGVHVVHCERMEQDFRRHYRTDGAVLWLCPAFVDAESEYKQRPSHSHSFTIGMLSNLTVSKGTTDAIELFKRLAERKVDVRLVLAGPCKDPELRSEIQRCVEACPERVEYRGPVYGKEKQRFFQEIDALVFPTRYRSESWGLVITEAMASGKPVIARGLSCIPWIMPKGAGVVVDPDADFVQEACRVVEGWVGDKPSYSQASERSLARMHELRRQAEMDWENILQHLEQN